MGHPPAWRAGEAAAHTEPLAGQALTKSQHRLPLRWGISSMLMCTADRILGEAGQGNFLIPNIKNGKLRPHGELSGCVLYKGGVRTAALVMPWCRHPHPLPRHTPGSAPRCHSKCPFSKAAPPSTPGYRPWLRQFLLTHSLSGKSVVLV